MARETHINILLDAELNAVVRSFAKRNGLTVSAVVRDALRAHFATVKSTPDRGWWEGYHAAIAKVRATVQNAISKMGSADPRSEQR